MAEQRENLIGGRQFSAMTGSAPISPELRAWTEDFLDIHLINGYGSTEDGVVLVDDKLRRPPVLDYKLVDVPELGYFATDRPHPARRVVRQVNRCHPRLLQATRGHRRTLRRRRLVPHRRRDGRARTRPAGLRRPPQQRAQAVAGRVRHRLQAGGGLRRAPVDPADLRVRQQRSLVRARGDRPHRRRAGQRRRRRRRGQAAAERRVAEHRPRGRPAVLRDPARLPRRDKAFHAGERTAHRHPQAGPPAAQGVLRPRARAAVRRPRRRPGRRAARTAGRRRRTGPCSRRSARPRAHCSAPPRPTSHPTRSSPTSVETRCRR